jgi:hypothetical protein
MTRSGKSSVKLSTAIIFSFVFSGPSTFSFLCVHGSVTVFNKGCLSNFVCITAPAGSENICGFGSAKCRYVHLFGRKKQQALTSLTVLMLSSTKAPKNRLKDKMSAGKQEAGCNICACRQDHRTHRMSILLDSRERRRGSSREE